MEVKIMDREESTECQFLFCETRRSLELSLEHELFWTVLRRLDYAQGSWITKMSYWLLFTFDWLFSHLGIQRKNPWDQSRRQFLKSLQLKCYEEIVISRHFETGFKAIKLPKLFVENNRIYFEHHVESRHLVVAEIAKLLAAALPGRNSPFQLMLLLNSSLEEVKEFARYLPRFPGEESMEVGRKKEEVSGTALGRNYWDQAKEVLKAAESMHLSSVWMRHVGPLMLPSSSGLRLEEFHECGNDTVVLMFFQAVELALKAFIICEEGSVAKSHNLNALASRVSRLNGIDVRQTVEEFVKICNADYNRLRYPMEGRKIPHSLYSETHRNGAFRKGQEIFSLLTPIASQLFPKAKVCF